MKERIIDIHTHQKPYRDDAINSINISDYTESNRYLFSAGIHPWYTDNKSEAELEKLFLISGNRNIVAIGETGIDHLCHIPIEKQIFFFTEQAKIAEQAGKPLIIHNVKGTQEILNVKKTVKPEVPWIIHGFRGNPTTAGQLTAHGIYLSFGEKFNRQTIAATDIKRILIETDESVKSITEIYGCIAEAISADPDRLKEIVAENVSHIFFKK